MLVFGILTLVLLIAVPKNMPNDTANSQVHFTLKPSTSQENLSEPESTISSAVSAQNRYTIRTYQGHIGVFLNDEQTPYREINVTLNTLPEEDRKLLEQGITANTAAEVQILLEDYIS